MSVLSIFARPLGRSRCSSAALTIAACVLVGTASVTLPTSHGRADPGVIYIDQGRLWTKDARRKFYVQDQGAQLILFSWLKAVKRPDGSPFLADSLTRYGYLPNTDTTNGLPVGFSLAVADQAAMVGMTCAACHTRQISVSGQTFRIDGGPAIADFETFLLDLDASTMDVLADPAKFAAFATAVLDPGTKNDATVAMLRADLTVWSVRFHTLMSRSLPMDRRWGPARLDAVSMIFNRVTGLDLGTGPTYLNPQNIVLANAPTRYPFLWNASRQDRTQWPGFAPNGNDIDALSRNLGEVFGVFGMFHPTATTGSVALFDRNYVVQNSANFAGLWALEGLIKRIGPPTWQKSWGIDQALADRGKVVYEQTKTGPAGGATCADCHGIHQNWLSGTWKTPIQNVGTDQAEWIVLGRYADTGTLDGASIPFVVDPALLPRDLAIRILKISVAGAIAEHGASTVQQDLTNVSAVAPSTGGLVVESAAPEGAAPGPRAVPMAIGPAAPLPTIVTTQTASVSLPRLGSLFRLPGLRVTTRADESDQTPPSNGYESRVLQGIWAAAPYLHNGSVPTLADLLKPAAQRPTSFAVGPAYDINKVGLAADQAGSSFTFKTTGCDANGLLSGDSNCGHEYGTQLPEDDKRALLEYMKTL